ncbi:hypothetical protein JCM8097_008529 [Rhodosporidiobolus ruineniae]
MSFTAVHLPELPAHAVAAGTSTASAPLGSLRSSKRRLSNATQLSFNGDSDDDDMDDDLDDPPHLPATRSKRSRPSSGGGGVGAPPQGSPKQPSSAQPGKALTEKEKEARRVARMIRNRNAAQASRDRKKEHTAFLERRVAELESQLRAQAVHPLAASSSASAGSSSSASSRTARSTREASIVSSTESASSSSRIADLEDENDGLRSQLHLEQAEKADLRTRLAAVEDKLASLSSLIHPSAALAGLSSPPLFATTSTPLSRYVEPTFAFDTPNLNPLPQPEERAYLEEREREKQQRQRRLSVGASSLGLTSTPPTPPSSSSTTTRTLAKMDVDSKIQHGQQAAAAVAAAAPFDSSRLVAREDDSSLQRKLSLSPSVSPAVSHALLPPFDFDSPTTGGSSTPPAVPESYLDLDEPVDVGEVWTTWAKGSLPASSKAKGLEPAGGDDEALAYLDLSFLQDASVPASC